MSTITIDGKRIGAGEAPYVIAELGINHNGDLSTAKQMLRAAAEAGADACKLQCFRTELFLARSSPYFDILGSCAIDEAEIRALNSLGEELGVTLFGSCFDEPSVDLMNSLGAPAFKVASGDLTNLPLLRHTARCGKPMIVSTGAATVEEIDAALEAIRSVAPELEVALMHCVSNYPTNAAQVNLACMATMEARWGVPVGFSDHTLGTAVPIAAVALGATFIEKHFTLDREGPGPDHTLSCDPPMLKEMVDGLKAASQAIGTAEKRPVEAPDFIPQLRRSVTALVAIPAGTAITRDMLAMKRPGTGIAPDEIGTVVGRTAGQDIAEDTTLAWPMFR